jgi:hypothetical protein
MESAVFVAIFCSLVAVFLSIGGAFLLSEKQAAAERETARARRAAEHRMNARLLRLNI